MLQIRNPATWNSPTRKRPERSPRSGTSGCRIARRAGVSRASVPVIRSKTNSSGGASASASFISGQLPAQVTTMIAR
jgi:hypothetical protein